MVVVDVTLSLLVTQSFLPGHPSETLINVWGGKDLLNASQLILQSAVPVWKELLNITEQGIKSGST